MGSLHPAIVHIPIGLLFVYSLMEIGLLFFPSYKDQLKLGKYIVLCVGILGGFTALSSGEGLEHLATYRGNQFLEIHSLFATITVWIYAVLAVAFTLLLVEKNKKILAYLQKNRSIAFIYSFALRIAKIVTRQPWLTLLAVAGLLTLSLTGALGGIIAHGADADPVTAFVYRLFSN